MLNVSIYSGTHTGTLAHTHSLSLFRSFLVSLVSLTNVRFAQCANISAIPGATFKVSRTRVLKHTKAQYAALLRAAADVRTSSSVAVLPVQRERMSVV